MDICINDGVFFRKLVSSIKELSSSAEFIFDDRGISIQCMDASHICIIDALISTEAMDNYVINGKYKLGINFENFNNILKLSKNSSVILKFIDGTDKLSIDISENKSKKINFDMLLTNIEVEMLEIPEIFYQFSVFMETSVFAKSVKDLAVFGTRCTITITDETLTFSVTGEAGTGHICITDAKITKTGSDIENIKMIFNIKYLIMFAKADLSDNMYLKFSPEYPFCCEYILDNASVNFYVAQITDDEPLNKEEGAAEGAGEED